MEAGSRLGSDCISAELKKDQIKISHIIVPESKPRKENVESKGMNRKGRNSGKERNRNSIQGLTLRNSARNKDVGTIFGKELCLEDTLGKASMKYT